MVRGHVVDDTGAGPEGGGHCRQVEAPCCTELCANETGRPSGDATACNHCAESVLTKRAVPMCLHAFSTDHGPEQSRQRLRAHDKAGQDRSYPHRESPAATRTEKAIRAQKPPPPTDPIASVLVIADQKSMADEHADAMAVRALHLLGAEQQLVQGLSVAHESL